MTTTTSFSNQGQFVGLYKSTLRRNFGYFGLISALLLVFYCSTRWRCLGTTIGEGSCKC